MSEASSNDIATGIRVFGNDAEMVNKITKALTEVGNLMVSNEPPPIPFISQGGSGVYGPATIFIGVKPIVQR